MWLWRIMEVIATIATTPFRWIDDLNRKKPLEGTTSPGPEGSFTMKRGVGYCEDTQCEDFAKGVFLLNHGDTFYCPRCRHLGQVRAETGFHSGVSDVFKEVRVEFDFDPIPKVFKAMAIVRDESLWGTHNTYTLQSPLIKTEKRALKVAEALLANLNRYRGLLHGDGIPATTEFMLSFDDSREKFSHDLNRLSKEWVAAGLTEKKALEETQ